MKLSSITLSKFFVNTIHVSDHHCIPWLWFFYDLTTLWVRKDSCPSWIYSSNWILLFWGREWKTSPPTFFNCMDNFLNLLPWLSFFFYTENFWLSSWERCSNLLIFYGAYFFTFSSFAKFLFKYSEPNCNL